MKILVTGATGFLGHHLVKRLIEAGEQVRIFKEPTASLVLLKEVKDKIDIIEGDIRNPEDVKKAVFGCSIVFHLVGIISYWSKLNDLQYQVNVIGTKNIVQACLENKVKRLIYVSSVVTQGISKAQDELADEQTLYNLFPLRINYCDTKFLAENEILKGIALGLDAIILSPGSMYGEGDVRKITSDLTFSFKFPFNFIYIKGGLGVVDVEDVVEALLRAQKINQAGQKYLLVAENLSYKQIRQIIAKELGKRPPFICLPNWFLYLLSYLFLAISRITGKKPKLTPEIVRLNKLNFAFSSEKARKDLGICFRPFSATIKRAVNWYKENKYL